MSRFYSFRRIIIMIIVVITMTFGLKFYSDHRGKSGDDDTAVILKVIDGDTFLVLYKGQEEKLRLIGIDTPETQANRKARQENLVDERDLESIKSMGNEARDYVKSILSESMLVRLEFDVQRRDRYGRMLAYVYLENGEMLNEKIIADGYANPMTYPPNVRYHQLFIVRHQDARYHKKGLWKH